MVELSELSELLLEIYRAARELPFDAFQGAALELFKRRLPFDSATWGIATISRAGLGVHTAHLHQEVPGRLQVYDEVKAQDPLASAIYGNSGRSLNFHLPTVYAVPERRGLHEYAKRVRHQNTLLTAQVLSADGPDNYPMRWLSLYRAEDNDQFSEHQRYFTELLVPHLMDALDTNRLIALKGLSFVDRETYGATAIVDREGVILCMDPNFPVLLQGDWAPHQRWALPKALRTALASGVHTFRTMRAVVAFQRFRDLAIVKVREWQSVDALTDRELQVAQKVAAGFSHKEIARRLGVSPATIRNHIQRIHQRLLVHNAAELAGRLREAGKIIDSRK